jgi:hypothetical protein
MKRHSFAVSAPALARHGGNYNTIVQRRFRNLFFRGFAMIKAATQFSVFLVNKPGILSRVCDALANRKVNVAALTLMDSVEHGVFRLVAEDVAKTRLVLTSLNLPTTETEVLAAEMPNRPGAMADLCARLNAEHVSIKYAYVTSGASGGRTLGIFKVDNLKKALKILDSRKPGRREKFVVKVPRGAARAR